MLYAKPSIAPLPVIHLEGGSRSHVHQWDVRRPGRRCVTPDQKIGCRQENGEEGGHQELVGEHRHSPSPPVELVAEVVLVVELEPVMLLAVEEEHETTVVVDER